MEDTSSNATPVNPPSVPTAKKVPSNGKLFAIGIVSLVVVAVLVLLGAGVYRVYAENDTGTFATGVARVLHLPIAKVGNVAIPFTEYAVDRRALSRMAEYNATKGDASLGDPLVTQDVSSQVLSRLIVNVIIDDLVKQYNVTVDQSEVDTLKQEVIAKFSSAQDFTDDLQKRFGWDMATYEERIMKPFILTNKLNEKIQTDPALREEVKKRAQDVLSKVKSGGNFAELAKQYGQDATANEGGDLGWFGKDVMVPEFEKAAFSLKKGEIAPELVESRFGYHIVRADDRRTNKTKNPQGKTVSEEQVKASHILFLFKDLDSLISEKLKETNVKVYGKLENPITKILSAGQAAASGE